MRGTIVALLGLCLSGCCTPPQRTGSAPATRVEASAPVIEAPAPQPAPVVMPASIAEATAEGFVVCRRDGDVRIVGVRELAEGKCLLVYDNRLSGNGTMNALASLEACELQQQRMRQNFERSGFRCD